MIEPLYVDDLQHGRRLDGILECIYPDMGLRGRRRLCDRKRVLVDGQPRAAGYHVRFGECITIREEAPEAAPQEHMLLTVAGATDSHAAINKPAGMHSAQVTGSMAPSVEAQLPHLLPQLPASWLAADATPMLLNRLDGPTSGLVLAARDPSAREDWLRAEALGNVSKKYLAIAHGNLAEPVVIAHVLDTDNRRTTRVRPEATQDPVRTTIVVPIAILEAAPLVPAATACNTGTAQAGTPCTATEHAHGQTSQAGCASGSALGTAPGTAPGTASAATAPGTASGAASAATAPGTASGAAEPVAEPSAQPLADPVTESATGPLAGTEAKPPAGRTLVLCCIHKGARHQIRAHMAHIGYPLVGDALYGSTATEPLRLHHGHVSWDAFTACSLPDWLQELGPEAAQQARHALESPQVCQLPETTVRYPLPVMPDATGQEPHSDDVSDEEYPE